MSGVDMFHYENLQKAQGFQLICGVDEAGRGPLAGPVCAAAVILPQDVNIPGLNDIKEQAIAYSIAFATEEEIDNINILQATFLAMQRAIDGLQTKADFALIDGNREKDFGLPVKTIVGGDGLSASIAAASILAKVTRDDFMLELAKEYPQYGFEVHKGYGTKQHYEALRQHGHCKIHRLSFLKKFYGEG